MYEMKETIKRVNVAPSSDEGHYAVGADKVVDLDEVTESFLVRGKSSLETKNHTTLEMDEDCLVHCQVVYNPLSKMLEKSKD